MTLPIQFSVEACAELDDAVAWYDGQRVGLGTEFLDVIDETLDTIADWPQFGARVEGLSPDLEVRRAPILRFPYNVGYIVLEDQVRILAVAHDRRRPAYWAPRVSR